VRQSANALRDDGRVRTALKSFLRPGKEFASGDSDGSQFASDQSQSIVGGIPILALDMYEHAYHIDFGTNAKAYGDAFTRNVDWAQVQARHEDAVVVARRILLSRRNSPMCQPWHPREVKGMLDSGKPVHFIDARPRHFVSRSGEIVEGAIWHDPDRMPDWAGELSKPDSTQAA
jgi:Fe-Mn family superoxide dismutase